MYLCGLIQISSRRAKNCILVIVNDQSRFTWTMFLKSKDDTILISITIASKLKSNFRELLKGSFRTIIQNMSIQCLMSFPLSTTSVATFISCTPQQNELVKIKNKILVGIARAMLLYVKVP